MQISNTLPQFSEKRSLIIVAGQQACRFYVAHAGEIAEERSLHVKNPQYTDREGFFEKKRGSDYYASGSAYEPKDEYVTKKFLKKLIANTKEVVSAKNIEEIYVLAASKTVTGIKEHLHAKHREMIREIICGNFVDFHPFEVLKKLRQVFQTADDKQREQKPIKEEARKVLEKTHQARLTMAR